MRNRLIIAFIDATIVTGLGLRSRPRHNENPVPCAAYCVIGLPSATSQMNLRLVELRVAGHYIPLLSFHLPTANSAAIFTYDLSPFLPNFKCLVQKTPIPKVLMFVVSTTKKVSVSLRYFFIRFLIRPQASDMQPFAHEFRLHLGISVKKLFPLR